MKRPFFEERIFYVEEEWQFGWCCLKRRSENNPKSPLRPYLSSGKGRVLGFLLLLPWVPPKKHFIFLVGTSEDCHYYSLSASAQLSLDPGAFVWQHWEMIFKEYREINIYFSYCNTEIRFFYDCFTLKPLKLDSLFMCLTFPKTTKMWT